VDLPAPSRGERFHSYSGGSGTGGGIDGAVTSADTIIAGNAAAAAPDCSGTVSSLGNSLVGETDGRSGRIASDLTGTAASPLAPLLGPLGNYGGPTQTMALLPGSPAIGAGTAVPGVAADQRGLPLDSPNPDIGAFQSQGFTLTPVGGSTPQSAMVGTTSRTRLACVVRKAQVSHPYDSKPPGRSAPFHGRISFNRTGTVASTCVGRRTDCALPHRSCTVRTLGRRILGPLVSSGRSSRRTIIVVPSWSNPRGALHKSR
jgi:hypothetical protein